MSLFRWEGGTRGEVDKMPTLKEIDEVVKKVLWEKGGKVGLTSRRLRYFLYTLGYDVNKDELGWSLRRLREKGEVAKVSRKLWKVLTYG
jgi:hypothetical protein